MFSENYSLKLNELIKGDEGKGWRKMSCQLPNFFVLFAYHTMERWSVEAQVLGTAELCLGEKNILAFWGFNIKTLEI